MAALPGSALAAENYVSLRVPDSTQAALFFRQVMNCAPVDSRVGKHAPTQLLDCGSGTIVEIRRDANSDSRSPALTVMIDDAKAVMASLRHHQIELAGPPQTVDGTPGRTIIAVDVVTPWGQALRLLSRLPTSTGIDASQATAN